MNLLKWLVCVVAGAVLGGAAGVGLAWCVGLYGQWKHPEDPSALSGAIIVMGTFPVGVLLGLVAGAYCADRWVKRHSGRGFEVGR